MSFLDLRLRSKVGKGGLSVLEKISMVRLSKGRVSESERLLEEWELEPTNIGGA